MSLKCELGFHNWRNSYLFRDTCEVQDKCLTCGAVRGKIVFVHKWESTQINPCLFLPVCKRCGEKGELDEKEHQWKISYKSDSFETQRKCESCGIVRTQPSAFSTFIGQEKIKTSVAPLVAAARNKGTFLHHLLLSGPAGMGKATLAKSIATEMGAKFHLLDGESITKLTDLEPIFLNLCQGDFLIIENIEAIRKPVLEAIIPAIANFRLDFTVGKGASTRFVELKLPHFTFIGLSVKPKQLNERLLNLMFAFNFTPYPKSDIGKIILLLAEQHNVGLSENKEEFVDLVLGRSNECPGEALSILKKVKEYAKAVSDGGISLTIAKSALAMFGSLDNTSKYERLPIPKDVKLLVWQRDRGRCVECGGQEKLEYDHVIPISKGGSNTERNIQLLCEKCNRSKHANIA